MPALFSSTNASGSTFTNTNINVDAGQVGYDPSAGFSLVHLQTFNLQLQYHLPMECKSFITGGYSQLSSNNIANFAGTSYGGTTVKPSSVYNLAESYWVNVAHQFTKQIRGALEFDRFHTAYADGTNAYDSRLQASAYFFF